MKNYDLLLLLGLCSLFLLLVEGSDISTNVTSPSNTTSFLNNKVEFCEYYNRSQCIESQQNGSTEGCPQKKSCGDAVGGDRRHCFALWTKDTKDNAVVSLKGCFLNADVCDRKDCVSDLPLKKAYIFCCCQANMCNQNVTSALSTLFLPESDGESRVIEPEEEKPEINVPILVTGYATFGLTFGFITSLVLYLARKHCGRTVKKITNATELTAQTQPTEDGSIDLSTIELREIKAHGCFGVVWKAQYADKNVAVKIFTSQHEMSWLIEKQVFEFPSMRHPNIVQFICAGKKTEQEYWLVTEFHELGSLYDYLVDHTLSWEQVSLIAESMTRGLACLHEQSDDDKRKPMIAHRDFKSKNVLLKSDLTACIADFGLAAFFDSDATCGAQHSQVMGTRRYMAPEILEGAITFRTTAFLRIDMYACALVLWELVSRCTAQEGPLLEYKLPYEKEVGHFPSLDAMQRCVLHEKVRPAIQEIWRNHPGLNVLCSTMEECWDYDAEARLTASCVLARIVAVNRPNDNNLREVKVVDKISSM